MVKPEQSRMSIYENPWERGTTIYCKRNWSNLDEALGWAEELFHETKELREHNRNEIITAGKDMTLFARLFCESILRIVNL